MSGLPSHPDYQPLRSLPHPRRGERGVPTAPEQRPRVSSLAHRAPHRPWVRGSGDGQPPPCHRLRPPGKGEGRQRGREGPASSSSSSSSSSCRCCGIGLSACAGGGGSLLLRTRERGRGKKRKKGGAERVLKPAPHLPIPRSVLPPSGQQPLLLPCTTRCEAETPGTYPHPPHPYSSPFCSH